jgi:N-methylhydantoinase B
VLYELDEATELTFYIGRDFGAEGFAGGQAGSRASVTFKRGTDVWQQLRERVPAFDDLSGEPELQPQQPTRLVNPLGGADVMQVRGMGGGGFGDPLLRSRDAVRRDVRDGFVSAERARQVYGFSGEE